MQNIMQSETTKVSVWLRACTLTVTVDLRTFDQLNRTMVTTLYRPDEYYPTFEDYERDIDLIVQMFSEAARYEDFFKEESSGA